MVPLFDQADINIGITLQARQYYLTCRYLPFALIVTDMLRISQLGLSLKSCETLFAFSICDTFMQRVWAVMGRRWLITCCNVVLFLVPVAVTLTLSHSSSTSESPPTVTYSKSRNCYDSKQSLIVIAAYVVLVIVEIEILSFMLYHSWKLYREHGNDIPLVRVLVRHNMFYFACGLLFSTTVAVVVVTLPVRFQVVIHGILATRMHRELYNTAHHTEESSTGNVSLPLVFAPASSEMQP
ncbi:hypothetical protein DFJ58DRAFT_823357, partial [Suillus subalutaceus]|uniref:uncharacterized protein n=1 Tax=Suillus subalutaceus TaxID=48586 RepID=UPI001B874747